MSDLPEGCAAWCELAASMEAMQRDGEALACYARAVEASPSDSAALWGLVRLAARRADPVVEPAVQLVLAADPPDPPLLCRVGTLLASTRWQAIALACLERGLQRVAGSSDPEAGDATAHAVFAELLTGAGRLPEAAAHYRQAIALAPGWPELHNNLGILARRLDDVELALQSFTAAVALRPGFVAALYNLGNAQASIPAIGPARDAYQRVLALDPAHAGALHGLAQCSSDPGEKIDLYGRALQADPGLTESLVARVEAQLAACDWSSLEADIAELRRRVREQPGAPVAPFAFAKLTVSAAEQLQCARNWVEHRVLPRAREAVAAHPVVFDHRREPGRRLRIGYLSADFRDHVVGRLMVDLLPAHDRSRVEVVGLGCCRDDGSAIRTALVAGCDRFHELAGLGLRALAQRIHDERIDVLIDLAGFTEGSRSEVLALRPAPVQLSWLGYPGTMGAPFVDAILADRVLLPIGHQPWYDESIVHLPHGYQPNPRLPPSGVPLPAGPDARILHGLPASGMVYASFNASYKLRPAMFSLWLRILRQVDGSVLWLSVDPPVARARLQGLAAAQGIDPARLVFAPIVPLEQHLARLPAADLFLDGFPYSAGATASQCVGQGVPLLTLTGETYVSRMATAILHSIGCGEFALESPEEYEQLAVALGRSAGRLADARRQVREGVAASSLFDPARTAADVEDACFSLWHAFCRTVRHEPENAPSLPDSPNARQSLP